MGCEAVAGAEETELVEEFGGQVWGVLGVSEGLGKAFEEVSDGTWGFWFGVL